MGYQTFPFAPASSRTEGLDAPPPAPSAPGTNLVVLMAAARIAEARVKPPLADVSIEGPTRTLVENLMAGIEAVRHGEAAAYAIEGPEGHTPLELTANNAAQLLAELRDMVGHEFPDILYPEVELRYEDDLPINAGVPPQVDSPA